MQSIGFYCDANSIEQNAMDQLQQYAQKPFVNAICAFTDIHYCAEKALPVGVAFETSDHCYPLINGKDIGCGVMYLKISKAFWLKPFDKKAHFQALYFAHQKMTDDGLGGGNHFLSIEEDSEAVYIICHTGTRDRGIALYQHCLQLTRDFSREYGKDVDFVHKDFLSEDFRQYYHATLMFGYERRKNFCIKTLLFLQKANYVRANKNAIDKEYLAFNFKNVEEEGSLMKEKQRREYKERFSELLNRSGNFPQGYIQEFDFAYKDATDIFKYQSYLKKVTQTAPVVTIKYTEI